MAGVTGVVVALIVSAAALILRDFAGDITRARANGGAGEGIATAVMQGSADGGTAGGAEEGGLAGSFAATQAERGGESEAESGARGREMIDVHDIQTS